MIKRRTRIVRLTKNRAPTLDIKNSQEQYIEI